MHVPYKGGGSALNDVISGSVQSMFVSYGTGSSQLKNGKIRALGVSSSQRSPALPHVPTLAEAGVRGYDSGVWYALLAPRGTPPEIVKRLQSATVAALRTKELRERFATDGIKPIGSTPEELTSYIISERTKWTEVVKRSGATVQ
ncbi:hypothetical protein D9M68_880340 [compost metagenome]